MEYRKNIRLKYFDYSSENYYFVTICTNYRKKLFVPRVSEKYGKLDKTVVVADPWSAKRIQITNRVESKIVLLEKKFPLEIDFYCFMENHIHLILFLMARQGRATTVSTLRATTKFTKSATTISIVVNAFKGWCTRDIGFSLFQPNFYEHVIRSEHSLSAIRQYILDNPSVDSYKIPWHTIDPAR